MRQVGIDVRKDITSVVLRKKARSGKDVQVASRLLGIANILDGMDRNTAARAAGMTRQTLRDWVRRYNENGIEGLKNKPKGHRPRTLTSAQEQEIETIVTASPEGSLVRWRRVDIQKEIKSRFKVDVHENTVGRLLRRLGFSRISVRPLHPETDASAQEDFKKTLPPRLQKSCLNTRKASALSSGSRTKRGLDKKER
jgi:transposase